jgi:hypothetical protein
LAGAAAVRALGRLGRRRADERQLYLTVGCTAATAEAFDALVRANGVPPALSPGPAGLSHLWLAPVLGPAVFLWSRRDGWSRHEPYVRATPAARFTTDPTARPGCAGGAGRARPAGPG